MSRILTLQHALGVVSVEADSSGVATEIRNRLSPYFDVTAEPETPDLAVTAVETEIVCPTTPAAEVMIRDHAQFERYRRPADLWELPHEYVMHERKNGSVFQWSKARPSVRVANTDAVSLAKSTRRLIQDFLRLRIWHAGGVIVEAATAAADGIGLLSVGGSGAGKTTLLARLLADGAAMVSNDEVGLCLSEDEVVAYGLPVQVNVRPPLIERFPRLAGLAALLEGEDRKAPVKYDEFVRALGGGIAAETGSLVGVLLSSQREPATDVAPEAFSAELMANLDPGLATSPWRSLPPGYPVPSLSETEDRVARITARLPAFRVGRLNETRYIVDAARSLRSAQPMLRPA